MNKAIGLIEARGFTTAVSALDAASKAAEVSLIGVEKVIGVGGAVGVNIQIAGEVAAVKAAVDAGVEAASKVGTVIANHVIPRPHDEVDKLIEQFAKNLKNGESGEEDKGKTKTKNKKANKEE